MGLVWIVQKARPVMIEAIARQYITGSMWRDYGKGSREFCGIKIPDGLKNNQKLEKLLITLSTKGILKGIPGVPEVDDVNISRKDIDQNLQAFYFKCAEDVDLYEKLLKEGFDVISEAWLRWIRFSSTQSSSSVTSLMTPGRRSSSTWTRLVHPIPRVYGMDKSTVTRVRL